MQYTITAYHLDWERPSNATEMVSTPTDGVNVASLRFVTQFAVSLVAVSWFSRRKFAQWQSINSSHWKATTSSA